MTFARLIPLLAAGFMCWASDAAQAAPLTTTAPGFIAPSSLGAARDLGRASGTTKISFSVVLPYQHAADLTALLKAQSLPGSAYYRHFMTSAQFRSYFSPTPAAYAAQVLALKNAGYVTETFANRTVIHAVGTAAAAERYFRTTIDLVRQTDGRLTYANVAPAAVPAALSGSRVVGLNGIISARAAAGQPSRRASAAATSSPLFGPDGGFGPLAISKAEDFPVEHGYHGANSNVADIIDGPVADSDIAAFLTEFGIKRGGPRTTQITVDGGCGASCFDSYESAIDAEWTLGMAPDASYFVYQITSLANAGIVDGFNAVVSDDAVNVVEFAVGGCEISAGDLQLAIQPIVAQGAAEGIAFESIAFGGANLCGLGVDFPMSPANLDTLSAVGGSSAIVDSTGKQLAESAYISSNGGVSATIDVPTWQASTAGVNPAGRNVPDVVIPGDVDGTGPSIYYEGSWQGGTPFINSAPFAGYLATVQEMYGYLTPLGNIAPALYATFNHSGYASGGTTYFTDVSLGTIGSVDNVPVLAKKGYDLATGIGSIGGGFALAKSFGFGPINPPTK